MLAHQNHHDVEDIPLNDNESDVTHVGSTSPYGKSSNNHIRERSPSDLSTWSYHSTTPNRAKRQKFTARALAWMRWVTIVFLQTVIILQLWQKSSSAAAVSHETEPVLKGKILETGDDISGLYKTSEQIQVPAWLGLPFDAFDTLLTTNSLA
jgi:hypothetical protein